jgi:hypothetical protein
MPPNRMFSKLKTPMEEHTRKMPQPFSAKRMLKPKVKEPISKEMPLILWACKPQQRDKDLSRLRKLSLESLST